MESPLLLVALIGGFLLVTFTPLWLLDALRSRRARKIDAAQDAAAVEIAGNAPELGRRMRAQFGEISTAELERIYITITDFIASVGYVDEEMLRYIITGTRLETQRFAAEEAAEKTAASETPSDSSAR